MNEKDGGKPEPGRQTPQCGELMNKVRVGVGEMFVGRPPKIICTILGSCIGLIMHDPEKRIGGVAHIMLDTARDREGNPAKYCDTAVPEMLRLMKNKGAEKERIVAKVFGGAEMFNFKTSHNFAGIGAKNINKIRECLKAEDIRIVATDVGGKCGRSIEFIPDTGQVLVKVNSAIVKTC